MKNLTGVAISSVVALAGCSDSTAGPNAGGSAPAAAAPSVSATVDGTERQITTDPADQRSPEISGDRIVWIDHRGSEPELYLYDLATNAERSLTPIPNGAAAISGDRVAYTLSSGSAAGDAVYVYDLATETSSPIALLESERVASNVAISGDLVGWDVWYHRDATSDAGEVYVYDFRSGALREITTYASMQQEVAISGDRIIWVDSRNNETFDVYMYDVATGVERRLTSDGAMPQRPAISGDVVVWLDFRNGNSDIYAYDLATGVERAITTHWADQGPPRISGSWIVWSDNRNGNIDLYLYDLATETEQQLTTSPANEFAPTISGNRVVWIDDRNGNHDVYLFEIQVTTGSLIAALAAKIDEFVAGGQITNTGVAESLRALVTQAAAAFQRGSLDGATRALEAFTRHVSAQAGRHISEAAASTLISMAQDAINSM